LTNFSGGKMGKRIKRIAPVQLGKLLAVIYALFSLIFVPIFLIISLSSPQGKGPGLLFSIIMPVIYIIFGFVGGVIGAFIYNLSAKWVGGIEIEFEE
jgi:hypothetical protein